MLGRIRVDEAIPLLGDLLDRGQAMVANVPSVDQVTELSPQLHICARSQKQESVVAEDSLRKVARLVRRMPGYRTVRRRAVPWIRKSATGASDGVPPVCHGVAPVSSAGRATT